MPPKRKNTKKPAAKKAPPKKVENNQEQDENDSMDEIENEVKHSNALQSEEDEEINDKKVVKKLERQLTYTDADGLNNDQNQKISQSDFTDEEGDSQDDQLNETGIVDSSVHDSVHDSTALEDSESEYSTENLPKNISKQNRSDAETENMKRGARGKAKPAKSDHDSDDEPNEKALPVKKGPAKRKGKMAQQQIQVERNMPSLSDGEGDDSAQESVKEHSVESADEHQPLAKSKTKVTKGKAGKAMTKPAPKTKKGAKEVADNKQSDGEQDDEAIQKKPLRAIKKKANRDEPLPIAVSPAKKEKTAKSKREANADVEPEAEEVEAPKKTGSNRAPRKQMAKNIDGKENEAPKRATKSGKPVKPPIKKIAGKTTAKPTAKPKEIESDSIDDKNQSIHLNLASSASITQAITASIQLLVNSEGKSSINSLRAFLEKEDAFDVKRNDFRIKKQLKEMFADGQIVPANKLKGKPSVQSLFKLGSLKKKQKSSVKRKSLKMAEKKKTQNAAKAKKATETIKTTNKNKKSAQTADNEELPEFDDDADVPPQYR